MKITKTHKAEIDDLLTPEAITLRGEPGRYHDADTGALVADYRPAVALPLRDTAWAMRGKTVSGNGPENFPAALQPWSDLIGIPALCGLITENFPPMPVHHDGWTSWGDNPGRTTMLTIYRQGQISGGEYVLAEYGLGFDMQDGDVLLSPTLNLHGNTPRTTSTDYVRLAIILCLDGEPK